MKTFPYKPLFGAVAAAVFLAGCAGPAGIKHDGRMSMMGSGKDGKSGCCCEGRAMMKDKKASEQGGMCLPAKDETSKGSCSSCGMDMTKDSGCGCCGGMEKKAMSSEVHKKHMEMMQQQKS